MAAHVQVLGEVENGVAGQTTTVISPSSKTVTVGNTILVGWGAIYDITATSVTDNLGNTYSRVERTRMALNTADLWYAPVTTGGSITTITVNHASTQYVGALAAEFSGVGTLSVAGAGTTGSSTTATWITSKTLPASGLGVGFVSTNSDPGMSPGSDSGSPSTAISESIELGGGTSVHMAIHYALPSTSDVTTFSGTTTLTGTVDWAGAGAVFSPAASGAVWTTPADTVGMSTTPDLQFNSPTSASAQHFQLQLDTANTFDTGNLRTYDSSTDQTNWTFWNGSAWTALPGTGLSTSYDGNEIRYSVTSALTTATWYRRVRAGTGG